MKNYFLLLAFLLSLTINAQTKNVDPTAVLLFDHMSDLIGELESCSFNLSTSNDVIDRDQGFMTRHISSYVAFSGPNKMLVHLEGKRGKSGIFYNGEKVTFYNYTENNYAIVDALDNSIATIDMLHFDYDIDFPAADFFYPAFTDDILSDFEDIQYLGKKMIDNEECFHIKITNDEMIIQYWITNDAYKLPKKYEIIYRKKDNMHYVSTFSNWDLNPNIPNAVFEFTAPVNSKEIKILAKTKSSN